MYYFIIISVFTVHLRDKTEQLKEYSKLFIDRTLFLKSISTDNCLFE
jgi:hypothetical protein